MCPQNSEFPIWKISNKSSMQWAMPLSACQYFLVCVFDRHDWYNIALRRWLRRVGPALTRRLVSRCQSGPTVLVKLLLWSDGRMWSGQHQPHSHSNFTITWFLWRFLMNISGAVGVSACVVRGYKLMAHRNWHVETLFQNCMCTVWKSQACNRGLTK